MRKAKPPAGRGQQMPPCVPVQECGDLCGLRR
jgi:hypothetical protein